MQSFYRGVLLLYTFFTTVIFLAVIPFLAGWVDPALLLNLFVLLPEQKEVFYVIPGLFILAGGWLFLTGWKKPPRNVVVQDDAHGKVRISLEAIEDLVEKTVLQNEGVREAKPRVLAHKEGVGISVRAAVTPDVKIPDLSRVIQEQVKDKIFSVTGITVRQVDVHIQSIAVRKQRVE